MSDEIVTHECHACSRRVEHHLYGDEIFYCNDCQKYYCDNCVTDEEGRSSDIHSHFTKFYIYCPGGHDAGSTWRDSRRQ